MRPPALLLGLLLALPAAAAPPDGGFCGRMLMPAVQLRVLSRGFSQYHSGVDLMAPYGSPIRAAAGGTVIYAGWYYAYGNIVDLGSPFNRSSFPASTGGPGQASPDWAGALVGVEA
jgi:murein DD-endopeptidase MepM/ murein hydrolase activator NlpD